MEADTIKQEPLSFITSEAECEDHSNSDLSDLITPKIESIDDDLKIPRSGSWKEEPDYEDIEMASVKQETYSVEAESFPGIKEEEVMIKSEIENSEDSESGNEGDGSEDVPKKRFIFACEVCDYKTHIKSYLENHILTKHPAGIEKQHPVLAKHIRVKHGKNDDNKYVCNMCKSRTHKETPVKTQYTCYLCVYKTLIKDDSNKKRKLYSCGRCDFKTYHNESLRSHLLSLHKTRYREYTCDFCNYKSYLKGSLNRHFEAKHKTDLCDNRILEFGDPREFNSKNVQDGPQNIDKVT